MPTMDLTGNQYEDVARIFSYMYFPEDNKRRGDFLFVLERLDDLEVSSADVFTFQRETLERLLHAPSPEKLSKEISNNFHKGCLQVGSILHNLLCFESVDIQKASLNLAIGLTKKQSKAVKSKYPETKIQPLTSASYWTYWKKYKSVSHLWGAYVALSIAAIRSKVEGVISCQMFLFESERYRLLGEKHIDKKTGKPALPPGVCWIPPEGYLPTHPPEPFLPGEMPDL